MAYAAYLKRSGKIEIPEWTDYCKTATHKDLSPYDADWYYIRAASMARKIYLRGTIGVGMFKRIYGGNGRRGVRGRRFNTSSGSVARTILRNLVNIGVLEEDEDTGMKSLSREGQRDLDRIASSIVTGNAI